MNSKEEVLLKFYTREMSEPYGHVPTDVIYKAMDEYAKQECIAFAQWIDENCSTSFNTNDKYILNDWVEKKIEFTREQLYELYNQSKNNTP